MPKIYDIETISEWKIVFNDWKGSKRTGISSLGKQFEQKCPEMSNAPKILLFLLFLPSL
jgi:hypothetical protein